MNWDRGAKRCSIVAVLTAWVYLLGGRLIEYGTYDIERVLAPLIAGTVGYIVFFFAARWAIRGFFPKA